MASSYGGPTGFVGDRKAGSALSTTTCVRSAAIDGRFPRAANASVSACVSRYPICPCDSATRTSRGGGGTTSRAASASMARYPTCGSVPVCQHEIVPGRRKLDQRRRSSDEIPPLDLYRAGVASPDQGVTAEGDDDAGDSRASGQSLAGDIAGQDRVEQRRLGVQPVGGLVPTPATPVPSGAGRR